MARDGFAIRSRLAGVLACLALTGELGVARAEDVGDRGRSQGGQLEPPRLLELAEAELPPAARAEPRSGTVVLKLLIDATGRVSEADVVTPMSDGYDEAARAAALESRFVPARRGAATLAARILFNYEFRLTETSPPASPPATTPPTASAAPPAAAAPPPAAAAPRHVPTEVVVQGRTVSERLRQSAQAVQVIGTETAKRRTADLGEVLARAEGVGVQRSGGLGSWSRLSINGLTDDQIRFFVDGVPLALSGYPFGVANVPVNLVERVEIYRGVVPVRFGADALGAAVNLVTDRGVRGTHGAVSYETGSFDTHRVTVAARHLHEPSGFLARATGFFDYARNDYPVDVDVANEATGRLERARVYRFHDAYRAAGSNVELGFVNRPWARRLLLRGFVTDYEKEHQHKFGVMVVPYGEVTNGETTWGGTLAYEQTLAPRVALDALVGYTYGRARFLDVSECIYDWFGRCIRERTQPGEDQSPPRDQVFDEHSVLGRLSLRYRPSASQAFQLSISPTLFTSSGDERRPDNPRARDRLAAEYGLFTWVHGLEHELDLLDDRLENIAFVKQYAELRRAQDLLPGSVRRFYSRDRSTHRVGVGDGLRFRFSPSLYAKASYEWATRLPRPEEVFGDGALILANLELSPESSHNANLGFAIDVSDTASGAWRLETNGFLRAVEQVIVLDNHLQAATYVNVSGGRSLGVGTAAGWRSPGDYLGLEGNLTYQDYRKTSDEGNFSGTEGARMPNRPWLFVNGSARLQLRWLIAASDTVALSWDTRYVHEFFLGWENWGRRDRKLVVPSQLVHSLALTYLVRAGRRLVSMTVEGQNITDQAAFDFYGVQRPGRAFYSKATVEL